MARTINGRYYNTILERMPYVLGDGYRLTAEHISPVIYNIKTPLGRTVVRGTYKEVQSFLDGILYQKRES